MTSPHIRPELDEVLKEAIRRHKKMPQFFCRKLKWRKRVNVALEGRRENGTVDVS